MVAGFLKFIADKKLFRKEDRVLLAVSGGLDSIVMTYLFKSAGINFGMAHCNFQLRGKESDGDEKLVKSIGTKLKVPVFVQGFETEKYAALKKISIQMAARELRYNFFEKVRKENKFDFIATAHHADDAVETVLINLIRGSGIAAYHGIAFKQKKIIRPLLFASRDMIQNYAAEKKLRWREDSSNESDKYIRNKIRHKIIPVLKEINPSVQKTFVSHLVKMNEMELLYKQYVSGQESKLVRKENAYTVIDLKLLKKLPAAGSILFEILRPFNLNSATVAEVLDPATRSSGSVFNSSTHSLLKNRDQLIVTRRRMGKRNLSFEKISNVSKLTCNEFSLVTEKVILTKKLKNQILSGEVKDKNVTYADARFVRFPLTVRHWQKGDTFFPLGMNHAKLLSDYFIDRKFSILEKEKALLLISYGKIIWILGDRLDDRFKIAKDTVNAFRFIFETNHE